MRRSEILLGLVLALLTVYVEANERKNQKNFFDFWKSEKAAPVAASDDLFLEGNDEGSGAMKESMRGDDDDDFESIDGSGDEMTNQKINLYDDEVEEENSKEEDEDEDDIIFSDPNGKGDDDEDLVDGSGSGEEVVEEEIVTVNVKPVDNKPMGKPSTGSPLSPCQNLRNSAFSVHQFIPECDMSGAFKKLQCYKDKNRCWCVNSNGVEIPGTNKKGPQKPDCDFGENLNPCVFQLVQHSQGLLGAFKPKCTLDGYYEPIQCQGAECWCVDKMGSEKLGSIKHKPEIPRCDQFVESTTVKTKTIKVPDTKGSYDFGPKEEPTNTIDVVVDPITIDDENSMEEEKNMQEKEEKTNSINDRESQFGENGLARKSKEYNLFTQPGLLAAIIGATVVGLLCIVLLVMFVVYRMRKKDEGSYPLEEQKYPSYQYAKAPEKEFYA